MNLEQTIADLEKQAAQYTEAANSLRALLKAGTSAPKVASQPKVTRKYAAKKGAGKSKKQSSKAAVSPETRAKISEALRASHAARKAQAE